MSVNVFVDDASRSRGNLFALNVKLPDGREYFGELRAHAFARESHSLFKARNVLAICMSLADSGAWDFDSASEAVLFETKQAAARDILRVKCEKK